MRAIILAAGLGQRLHAYTKGQHKALIEIAGQPIIDRLVQNLIDQDVTDILVVTGHQAHEVEKHLCERFSHAACFQFLKNERYLETNNIYSLALALDNIPYDQDILLFESDLIVDPQILFNLIHSKKPNIALVDRYEQGMDGTVVKIRDQLITEIIPPHLQSEHFDFSQTFKTLNIYRFDKSFCENYFAPFLRYYADEINRTCYYELILGILIYTQNIEIYAESVEGLAWAEVDDPNDVKRAEFLFNPQQRRHLLDTAWGGFWNYKITDFCFLRNMYFPDKKMLSELQTRLPDFVHNYGSSNAIVNQKMSYLLKCDAQYVTALNGASQIYPILKEMFSNKTGLIPFPTFNEYTQLFNKIIPYHDHGDVDQIKLSIQNTAQADVIVFVNPNNPSGTTVESDYIFQIAESHPSQTVLVDESFIEFSNQPSIILRLEKQPLDNVLVIKSLSKSYGCPGIRLGAVYTKNENFLSRIQKSLPIWNMNSIAENFLETTLKNQHILETSFKKTRYDRELFYNDLKKINDVIQVFQSGGNFILIKLKPFNLNPILDTLLLKYGLYLKDASKKFPDQYTYLRLSVRNPHENQHLVCSLAEVLTSQNKTPRPSYPYETMPASTG